MRDMGRRGVVGVAGAVFAWCRKAESKGSEERALERGEGVVL